MGEMSPFVTIEYQGMEFKTLTIKNGGKHPVWNQTFEIHLFSLNDEVKITCYDEDML